MSYSYDPQYGAPTYQSEPPVASAPPVNTGPEDLSDPTSYATYNDKPTQPTASAYPASNPYSDAQKDVVVGVPVATPLGVQSGGDDVIGTYNDPPVITYMPPTGGMCWFVGSGIVALIWVVAVAVFITIFTSMVSLLAPVKGVCTSDREMRDNLCILSVGQFAYGIITIGQFGIGLINLSQIGIGLIFAVGQIQGGCGFTTAQITIGSYIGAAQMAIALIRVHMAQIGFQLLWPWRRVNGEQPDLVVSCHKNCGNRRRRNRFGRM